MPNTKNKSIMRMCSPSEIKIQVGLCNNKWGKKSGKKREIGWLELVHKKREKKKLAGLCSQICPGPSKGDCIHACWSFTPANQVPLWLVILGKRTDVRMLFEVCMNMHDHNKKQLTKKHRIIELVYLRNVWRARSHEDIEVWEDPEESSPIQVASY